MKLISLLITVLVGSVLGVVAQTQPAPKTFTLQECIDYALENTAMSKNAKLDEEIAEAKVKETIGIGLPQINGSASIMHNEKLPRFFNTYSGPDGFIDFSGVDGIEVGDVVAAENFFQLKSSGDVGLSVNQLIFNGSYLVGLKASKTYKELAYKSSNLTKEVIIESVTKAYYAVLINKERIDLFSSNIARVDTLLRNTTAMFKNGFAEEIDADRIQVTLNNLTIERDRFLNVHELGLQLLKFQMNYPGNQPIEVSGSIKDVSVAFDKGELLDYSSRADYQVLEVNKKLQELNIRNRRAASMPTLGAFLNYGYSTQSGTIGGLFKTNSNIADAGGVGPDKWYNYSSYGVSLNIPIFTGLQNHYKVQQEQIALRQINNDIVHLEANIDYQVKLSSLTYDNAIKSLKIQEENTALAKKVANVTKIKYEQGVGSNLEVVDAEDALRQAQTNYYNAMYDVMLAKVELMKAYGQLVPQTETK